jgi:RNA polymerase sigma-70 factor (ECF subfamily)
MTKEEFKTLVLPVREKLFRLALSLLSDRQEAEDTLQDAFLKLWSIRSELGRYRSLEALAVTITKNLCLDKLRSYRHRKKDSGGIEQLGPRSYLNNPEALAELNESSRTIYRFVQMLPEQQRLVMHLRDIEQHSYEEIEELTGLTRNNIRVQLSRARKQVREAYIKYQDYEHRKN